MDPSQGGGSWVEASWYQVKLLFDDLEDTPAPELYAEALERALRALAGTQSASLCVSILLFIQENATALFDTVSALRKFMQCSEHLVVGLTDAGDCAVRGLALETMTVVLVDCDAITRFRRLFEGFVEMLVRLTVPASNMSGRNLGSNAPLSRNTTALPPPFVRKTACECLQQLELCYPYVLSASSVHAMVLAPLQELIQPAVSMRQANAESHAISRPSNTEAGSQKPATASRDRVECALWGTSTLYDLCLRELSNAAAAYILLFVLLLKRAVSAALDLAECGQSIASIKLEMAAKSWRASKPSGPTANVSGFRVPAETVIHGQSRQQKTNRQSEPTNVESGSSERTATYAFSSSHCYFSACTERGQFHPCQRMQNCVREPTPLRDTKNHATGKPGKPGNVAQFKQGVAMSLLRNASIRRCLTAVLTQASTHHMWVRMELLDALFSLHPHWFQQLFLSPTDERGAHDQVFPRLVDEGANSLISSLPLSSDAVVYHIGRLVSSGHPIFRHCLLLHHNFFVSERGWYCPATSISVGSGGSKIGGDHGLGAISKQHRYMHIGQLLRVVQSYCFGVLLSPRDGTSLLVLAVSWLVVFGQAIDRLTHESLSPSCDRSDFNAAKNAAHGNPKRCAWHHARLFPDGHMFLQRFLFEQSEMGTTNLGQVSFRHPCLFAHPMAWHAALLDAALISQPVDAMDAEPAVADGAAPNSGKSWGRKVLQLLFAQGLGDFSAAPPIKLHVLPRIALRWILQLLARHPKSLGRPIAAFLTIRLLHEVCISSNAKVADPNSESSWSLDCTPFKNGISVVSEHKSSALVAGLIACLVTVPQACRRGCVRVNGYDFNSEDKYNSNFHARRGDDITRNDSQSICLCRHVFGSVSETLVQAAPWALPFVAKLLPLVQHIFTNARTFPADLLGMLEDYVHQCADCCVQLYEWSPLSSAGVAQRESDLQWLIGNSLLDCCRTLALNHSRDSMLQPLVQLLLAIESEFPDVFTRDMAALYIRIVTRVSRQHLEKIFEISVSANLTKDMGSRSLRSEETLQAIWPGRSGAVHRNEASLLLRVYNCRAFRELPCLGHNADGETPDATSVVESFSCRCACTAVQDGGSAIISQCNDGGVRNRIPRAEPLANCAGDEDVTNVVRNEVNRAKLWPAVSDATHTAEEELSDSQICEAYVQFIDECHQSETGSARPQALGEETVNVPSSQTNLWDLDCQTLQIPFHLIALETLVKVGLLKDASAEGEGLEDNFCCSRRGACVDASSTAKDSSPAANDHLPANASSRTTLFSIRLEFSPSRFFLPVPAMIFPFIEALRTFSAAAPKRVTCDTTEGGGAASCSDANARVDDSNAAQTRPLQLAFPFLYQRTLRLIPLMPTPISIPVRAILSTGGSPARYAEGHVGTIQVKFQDFFRPIPVDTVLEKTSSRLCSARWALFMHLWQKIDAAEEEDPQKSRDLKEPGAQPPLVTSSSCVKMLALSCSTVENFVTTRMGPLVVRPSDERHSSEKPTSPSTETFLVDSLGGDEVQQLSPPVARFFAAVFLPPRFHLLFDFRAYEDSTVVHIRTDRWQLLQHIDSFFDEWIDGGTRDGGS